MDATISLYEILGGDRNDDKNNILKSLFITTVSENRIVEIEAEPYDDAYKTNDMVLTIGKICRVLDRREKTIFKKLSKFYQKDIDSLSITVFDEWRACGGIYKVKGEKCQS